MFEVVEVGVLEQRIAEVRPDGLVDAGGPLIAGRHQLLQGDQPLGSGDASSTWMPAAGRSLGRACCEK